MEVEIWGGPHDGGAFEVPELYPVFRAPDPLPEITGDALVDQHVAEAAVATFTEYKLCFRQRVHRGLKPQPVYVPMDIAQHLSQPE